MTLMVAGVACLAVSSVWHVGLAVLSAREASRQAAGASTAADHVRPRNGGLASPSVLWLVLINPSPTTLSAVRAVGLRLRCRTRAVVVVSDLAQHERLDHADTHRLAVPPGMDRAEVLNRAYRLIRAHTRNHGEDPTRAVVGVIDAGAVPDGGLAVAVWQAFREPHVGAVQARVQVVGADGLCAGEQYERGVLVDAANLRRSRRGRARLGVNGAFVRLSELSRLGSRPWRSGAIEDYELTARLRRLGVVIRHCSDMRVFVPGMNQNAVVRQYAGVAQGRLQGWPPSRRRRWERMSWALRVAGWPLPGLVAMWAFAAFATAAGRLLLAVPEPPVGAPRWHALVWTAMAMDTPSWLALAQAVALWVGAAVAPVFVWWVARRDLAFGSLVRGALCRPLLLLARPVAFGLAVVRSMVGWRTGDPVGQPMVKAPLTSQDMLRAESVFVDATGRRRRRMWTVAYGTSLAGIAYVVVVGFALVSQQISPDGGVGDRPHVSHPTPTPTPSATTPIAEPTVVPGGGGAGGVDVAGTAPPSQTGPAVQPSASVDPSVEPSGLVDPSVEPSGLVDPSVEPSGSVDPSPSDEPSSSEPSGSDEPSGPPEPVESPSSSESPADDIPLLAGLSLGRLP